MIPLFTAVVSRSALATSVLYPRLSLRLEVLDSMYASLTRTRWVMFDSTLVDVIGKAVESRD